MADLWNKQLIRDVSMVKAVNLKQINLKIERIVKNYKKFS